MKRGMEKGTRRRHKEKIGVWMACEEIGRIERQTVNSGFFNQTKQTSRQASNKQEGKNNNEDDDDLGAQA
jgi:hypothetical protein